MMSCPISFPPLPVFGRPMLNDLDEGPQMYEAMYNVQVQAHLARDSGTALPQHCLCAKWHHFHYVVHY